MTGIRAEAFSERFPLLFHMAEAGSWPSIQRHGLLSTSALLDLFEVRGERRRALEARHRPESVTLHHPRHGTAVIRDQKPMSDAGLLRSLSGGLSPADWYQLLNARVFFWVSHERLMKLLKARAYRDKRQTVLTVDTARLLALHEARVLLSPRNSGATKPFPWPRGPDTFLPMARYPFSFWDQKRKRKNPVAELTVTYAVPDIRDFVLRVEEYVGGQPDTLLFKAR
ncbi:hypothetical protein SAMN05444354_116162 [Stigmatella aurantiaca]|uniref:Uncharacterized protein n=1 Tax=Stigmatella aurantiaca TaxID=41 RepID=A0A1H7Y9P2_STIAU|nr:hypothetical protein [Stigmatella aurantiaca]SEM42882.1 hypothetical protein SAMN05444354_116162 [Stigmatella aurantiaca]